MPRYYIDVDGGEQPVHDSIGAEHACSDTARRHAIHTVTSLAQSVLMASDVTDCDARDFTVKITSETGEPIYEALLSFRGGPIGAVP